jgi:hypothetical protein
MKAEHLRTQHAPLPTPKSAPSDWHEHPPEILRELEGNDDETSEDEDEGEAR